jgi:tripeptide aminopeptidase
MTARRRLVETVIERTVELASVPAPTGSEAARAAVVRSWWETDGYRVEPDAAGNVWGCARAGLGRAVVLCAHLDTVFPAETNLTIHRDGDRLLGPSVGDDSVGVAALSAAAVSAAAEGSTPVWLLATVGEEGFGNLRGANAALDDPPTPIAAFIAVEGNYLGRISTVGVGSERRRIHIRGPGGHAWEAADTPSAVHHAASLIARIDQMPHPVGTAVNVGRVGGGEGINIRARDAWFELDLRADRPEALEALTGAVQEILADVRDPLAIELEALGSRPAGSLDPGDALVVAAQQALTAEGIDVTYPSTSTDANAAHARDVPAVALGVTHGAGEHTLAEWIELPPLERGIRALAGAVDRYEEARR